ncbi:MULTISPECIES: hypothetical protein [unclassified Dietzia]|uniref:hypothetical protein n=1 Tax=unclassified Dietzia TaxID=2617939 RepID=UPI0015FBF3BA|nr:MULTISPECIES: hypothetical protein [unclassified Dietzia]MBB1026063.1 hypothetical protein [Dietzia sp. DQ12-76]MBB1027921.1 hypothetical protein [Dietzia sp. DQ11-38-2]
MTRVAVSLAVDLSCSGLAVASASASTVLSPSVTPTSVLAGVYGTALPPGGDRIECSDRVDSLALSHPDRCLLDPVASTHRDRTEVAGLSVPVDELLAAPVSRALRWGGAGEGDGVVLLVPSEWGNTRSARLAAAAEGLGVAPRIVRSALVTADALPSSSARWAVCVEASEARTMVSLVERTRGELTLIDRALVHRWDPRRDSMRDDEVSRVIDAVTALRRARREAGTGSTEVLARGRNCERVVDACDQARLLSFVVPETAPVEAALRLHEDV